jgi:hypothetical protein
MTVTLKSGRELKISLPSFVEAKVLYQAILKELKAVDVAQDHQSEFNIIKELMCTLLASEEIEEKLWPCMKRCTYNKHRILGPDTFEKEDAREDYLEICVEVALASVSPFTKNLSVLFEKGARLFPEKSAQP